MAHLEKRDQRLHLYTIPTRDPLSTFIDDVRHGLAAPQKYLPAKYFYDDCGSQLYEQICDLPEYYPYRAEKEILATYAEAIHAEIGHLPLIELGSGNATTRSTLDSATLNRRSGAANSSFPERCRARTAKSSTTRSGKYVRP